MAAKPSPPQPWHPATYAKADAYALKALARGEASAEQQKRAIEWIVYEAAKHDDMSFRPGGLDGDRATTFAEGRRFVGLQVLKLVQMRADVIERMKDA